VPAAAVLAVKFCKTPLVVGFAAFDSVTLGRRDADITMGTPDRHRASFVFEAFLRFFMTETEPLKTVYRPKASSSLDYGLIGGAIIPKRIVRLDRKFRVRD